jgi:signal transduction histidine kinase/CheY-like chemotaxis protein
MENTQVKKGCLTKSMAITAADTPYTALLRKVISSLIVRSLIIFLLGLYACYFLSNHFFARLEAETPAIYAYILLFSLVYLTLQLFLTAYVLKKQVILPLKNFIEAAQDLVSGSKDVQLDVVRSNEFLNLNEAFKFIKIELDEKESYQKSLEQLIDERTVDLKKALKIAESSTQAKSEFFANITHELRTPLNGIMGMTDLVLDTDLTMDQRNSLEIVREAGNNLLSLVNDFLDYSKIEAGKMSLYNENLNLSKLINRCLLILNIKADEKGIIIVEKVEKEVPPYIVSDHLRIKQLIQNLISNSIKFSNSCGAIIVWVGLESIKGDDIELHFAVADAGIGIPKEKTELIFETFQQADENTARKYGGSGLGLSICKEIVNLMGGKIWVISKEGIGTAIHFTVKSKVSHAERDLSSDNIVLPQPGQRYGRFESSEKKHILVCEDNPVNSKLVVAMLERIGHTVSTAENGEKAIEKLQTQNFDLVLMDCQMPVMNGFETTQYIRQKKKVLNPELPIIALTANASTEDMKKCLECGMNAYITKPIKKEEFYETLNAFLPKQL